MSYLVKNILASFHLFEAEGFEHPAVIDVLDHARVRVKELLVYEGDLFIAELFLAPAACRLIHGGFLSTVQGGMQTSGLPQWVQWL